jgi:hypothetical protein
MVRLFNKGDLPVLFCTSTLIEGVNTAAKTVLIYDKAINRSNFDFFTYSNIKGRAGRLGQHHVGQVYLFNAPPDEDSVQVAPTLFAEEDDAPDDYVVHLDEFETSSVVDGRFIALVKSLQVSKDELALAATVGLDNARLVKEKIEELGPASSALAWSGVPKYPSVAAVLQLICSVRRPAEFGVFTAKQLGYMVNQLRFAKTMRGFLNEYDANYTGDAASHDNIFKFLRACEYGLPQYFAVVELFVKQKFPSTDYSWFIHELSRWFMPEVLKNLDEEGVPMQVSERFFKAGDNMQSMRMRLELAVNGPGDSLSAFEVEWLAAALDMRTASE